MKITGTMVRRIRHALGMTQKDFGRDVLWLQVKEPGVAVHRIEVVMDRDVYGPVGRAAVAELYRRLRRSEADMILSGGYAESGVKDWPAYLKQIRRTLID